MGATPTTLMAGLTCRPRRPTPGAHRHDDHSGRGHASSPTARSVTVSGTAADAGGGVVTNVEVSLDGGATYNRATGTTSWTYTGVIAGVGASSIKVRASDDSANLSAADDPARHA